MENNRAVLDTESKACFLMKADINYRRAQIYEKKEHVLEGPGQQWGWKITLTILCAVVGAIVALYLFRVL